jgi:predicted nucleotidyltransferase
MASLGIPLPKGDIDRFCHRWKVAELALFGSVLREDFGADGDVDVMVSFAADARWTLFDLVRMEGELKTIVGRDVDLVERAAIERSENYIRRKSVLANVEVIHAAG